MPNQDGGTATERPGYYGLRGACWLDFSHAWILNAIRSGDADLAYTYTAMHAHSLRRLQWPWADPDDFTQHVLTNRAVTLGWPPTST